MARFLSRLSNLLMANLARWPYLKWFLLPQGEQIWAQQSMKTDREPGCEKSGTGFLAAIADGGTYVCCGIEGSVRATGQSAVGEAAIVSDLSPNPWWQR